jgi:hypothetical protein
MRELGRIRGEKRRLSLEILRRTGIAGRLDVNRLKAIPGITASQKVFRFESIEELIGKPCESPA